MRFLAVLLAIVPAVVSTATAQNQEAVINVQADKVLHPVSRYLTGACIEDVNHEIYGGIYSQMIFGESFQEPVATTVRTFTWFGGMLELGEGDLLFSEAAGDRLISDWPPFLDGEVGVEVFVGDAQLRNTGLMVRVMGMEKGKDFFDGYVVSLDAAKQQVWLGRHRRNWEPIQEAPCEVPVGEWVPLVVRLSGPRIEVLVNGKSVLQYDDGANALPAGMVGLRQFQPGARYRKLWVKTGGEKREWPYEYESCIKAEVSGMWRPFPIDGTGASFGFERTQPFMGVQSQRMTFVEGQGEVGVENQGLNRWGMSFASGKPYEGILWARADAPIELFVALEDEGYRKLAEEQLSVKAGDWQKLQFTLVPDNSTNRGRFAVTLREPGSVVLGYASLQPGEWGKFKGLPVRKEVVEGLIGQGITILRYGGSMINDPHYRWKNMIGPRDRRPPYHGTWCAYSSNGWGILDFMNFCEAAGFEYVPAFNMGETPQDMADFIDYAKGPADSEWGRKRAADGHPEPYRLRYIELGNEERVDEKYAATFEELARVIWAKDPEIVVVVGDFVYSKPIEDPFNFTGAASGIKSLAGQQRVLQFAKSQNREVWFDVHVGTDGPRPDSTLAGMFSYRDALAKIADGARFKVLTFEFNSGNHSQKRAVANAMAINAIERDGQIPIATSANCLQPDGQNDNGWDQGLLFLNPSQVWLQPPGYVTQMVSRDYLPLLVQCNVTGAGDALDVTAKRSEDGKTLVLQAVNATDKAVTAQIQIGGFTATKPKADVVELAGPLDAVNTAAQPSAIVPLPRQWKHNIDSGTATYTFPPFSVTLLRWT